MFNDIDYLKNLSIILIEIIASRIKELLGYEDFSLIYLAIAIIGGWIIFQKRLSKKWVKRIVIIEIFSIVFMYVHNKAHNVKK